MNQQRLNHLMIASIYKVMHFDLESAKRLGRSRGEAYRARPYPLAVSFHPLAGPILKSFRQPWIASGSEKNRFHFDYLP